MGSTSSEGRHNSHRLRDAGRQAASWKQQEAGRIHLGICGYCKLCMECAFHGIRVFFSSVSKSILLVSGMSIILVTITFFSHFIICTGSFGFGIWHIHSTDRTWVRKLTHAQTGFSFWGLGKLSLNALISQV